MGQGKRPGGAKASMKAVAPFEEKLITDSEITCPCEENVSEDQCEDCQDLERGTLAYWRKLKQSQSIDSKP
jgi:hypothetical protein